MPRALPALGLIPLLIAGSVFADDSNASAIEPADRPSSATLRGRVIDAEARAIAGATVRLLPDGLSMWSRDRHIEDWVDPVVVVTGDDGRFEAPEMAAPLLTVRADAPGLAPRTVHGVSADDLVSLELSPGRRIDGTVRSASDGRPLEQARVTICDAGAFTFGRDACRTGLTDEAGRFAIGGLSRRELALCAVAHAHAVSELRRVNAGAEDVTGLELRLSPGAGIEGKVIDHRGRPIEGARVRLKQQGLRLGDRPRTNDAWPEFTDREGSFRIEGAPAGLSLELRSFRGDRPPSAPEGPLHLRPGTNLGGLKIVMPAAARLTWRLVDPDGEWVEGVELYRQPAGDGSGFGPLSRAVNPEFVGRGEDGRWTVRRLDPGRFDFLIVPEGFAEIFEPGVMLNSGETFDLGTLPLESGRPISGFVTAPDGGPIAAAGVQAWDGGPVGATSRRTETDPDGAYVIEGLRDGEVSLYVEADGYFGTKVEVAPGETNYDVTLEAAASVVGLVELEDGGAPPSFSVSLHAEADAAEGASVGLARRQSFVTPDGSFRVTDISPGTYTLEVRAPDWAPGKLTGIGISAEEPTDVGTITLTPGMKLSGRVVALEDGTPVPGAAVELRLRRGWMPSDEPDAMASAVSQDSGAFELSGVVPGEYTIQARHTEFARAEVAVRVEPDPPGEDVVLRLPRGGVLTGTVRGGDGQPSPERTIVLGMTLVDPDARSATSNLEGIYRLDRIAAGSYEARLLPDAGGGLSLATQSVAIVEGEVTVLDFDDESGIRVHGTVLRGGEPVVRALLFFTFGAGGMDLSDMQASRTADDGAYEVRLDRPGVYRVVIQTGVSGGSSTQITVPNQPEFARDILLELEGIAGAVLDDEDAPVPGASISAKRDGSTAGSLDDLLIAESDSSGRYSIEGLPPGTYRVTAVATGYRIGVVYPVEVGAAPVDQVDFRLDRGHPLRGIVVDPQGRGVGGTYVLAAPAGGGDSLNAASAETDVNGAFRMTAPAEGLLDVTALAPGWAPAHIAGVAAPPESDPAGLVLHLRAGGAIRGAVVDSSGRPRPGVQLSVRPVRPYVGSDLARLLRPIPSTNGDGRVLVEHLAPGAYAVSVVGYPEVPPANVAVAEGAETPFAVSLPE